MSRGKWATIKLQQLLLDQQNYRIGPQANQRDAIRMMIEEQGHKLVRIAKDILEMGGVSPGEPIWVVPSGIRGQYIVEEGNRRVTALKLLETPALADGTSVSKQFRRLAKDYAASPIKELEARLFENREAVTPWKRRRHLTAASGVGLAPWRMMAKGRANRDMGLKAPRSLAVFEFFANDTSEAWAEIQAALDNKWTTVDRVLNTEAFADVLGIHIDSKSSLISFENGDEASGRDLLQRVLNAMAAPDFAFADVENKDDRRIFIEKFSEYNVKSDSQDNKKDPPSQSALSAPSRASTASSDQQIRETSTSPPTVGELPADEKPSNAPNRRKTVDLNRKTLAPREGPRLLLVQGARLAKLYDECCSIVVKKNPNAAAFLVRVFIELSSETFLEEKGVNIPPSLKGRGINEWSDYKVKLADKIAAVTYYLDSSVSSPVFAQARAAIKPEATGPSSIKNLHSYFHNQHVLPDEATVQASWDSWEAYLRELHRALNQSE